MRQYVFDGFQNVGLSAAVESVDGVDSLGKVNATIAVRQEVAETNFFDVHDSWLFLLLLVWLLSLSLSLLLLLLEMMMLVNLRMGENYFIGLRELTDIRLLKLKLVR